VRVASDQLSADARQFCNGAFSFFEQSSMKTMCFGFREG
jgi:hypothetical protein